MGEQHTFAGLAWDGKKKRTRREQFLGEMNAVIPWAALDGSLNALNALENLPIQSFP